MSYIGKINEMKRKDWTYE